MNDERQPSPCEASHQTPDGTPACGTAPSSEPTDVPTSDQAPTSPPPQTARDIVASTPCRCADCTRPDGSVFDDLVVRGINEVKQRARTRLKADDINIRFKPEVIAALGDWQWIAEQI